MKLVAARQQRDVKESTLLEALIAVKVERRSPSVRKVRREEEELKILQKVICPTDTVDGSIS